MSSLDGGEPTRIADRSYRFFIPQAAGGSAYLVGVNATGAVVRAFDPARLVVTGPAMEILRGTGAVSASENGILVASTTGSRMRAIPTWFDRKGPIGPVGQAGNLESIGLSADGHKLVVTESAGPEQGSDLWLRDLGSGARTRLTFGRGGTAVWSPDGRRLVYTSPRNGVALPYQRAADGTGNETPLFSTDHETYVNDWSSDGRWLIYSFRKREQIDNDLWIVPMTGGSVGTPVPYIEGPGKHQQAQFSPDGRFVAYGSDQTGTFEIYVQPFPDPSSGKWMVSSGGGVEPRWSRDGRELFYFSGQTLMSVPVSTTPTFSNGPSAALFSAAVQAGYTNDGHRWQVAPDGKQFLLLIPDGQQQGPPLEVIANWPALLKQ